MKFRRILPARILLFFLFLFPALRDAHAEGYNVETLTTCLEEKLLNIQKEYPTLRDKKNLQYFWDPYSKIDKISFELCGKLVASTKDMNDQADKLFSFLEPNLKGRMKQCIAVLMSKDFLYMILGKEAFVTLLNGLIRPESTEIASFKLNIFENNFENTNEIPTFELWFKHALVETERGGETHHARLFFAPVFTYDSVKNTIRFVGLKYKPVVNDQHVTDTNLPMHSGINAEVSVPKDNAMDIE